MNARKKTETGAGREHEALAAELTALIPQLDAEGLAFLVGQARVHLYNMALDREAAAGKERDGGGEKTGRSLAAGTGSGTADFRVERSSSGSSYHLISGGKWKMYNEGEMLALVRVAQSKDPLPTVARRLHGWFASERPDTFADLELGDEHDPKLKELVLFLRKKFNVRGAK